MAARDWFAPFILGKEREEFTTGNTEDTEKEKVEERKIVALERKSPPLQTKGGAPVIFQEVVHSI